MAQTQYKSIDLRGYLDLNKNELRNATLQNLGSDIASPVDGLIFYRSDTDRARLRANGAWVDLATTADITAGAIASTIVDAKGDLIVGTAADTVARKAAGANGTALFADSAQSDGLNWRVIATGDVNLSATSKILGRVTAGAGVAEELTLGTGLEFSGSAIQNSAFTGDITKAAGSNATTIGAGTVTLAKMANLAANSIIGNNTGGATTPIALTVAQTITLLNTGSAFDTQVRTSTLNQMTAPTADLSMNTHKITNLVDGTATTDAATWGQVSAILEGKTWKTDPAQAATTGALPNTPTYNSGSGTLTANTNAALPAQDGVTLAVGETLLVKNQASSFQNGIYTVTAVGSGAAPWVLTRRADANTFGEIQKNATIYVSGGTTQGGDVYTQTSTIANLTADTQTWTKTGDTNVVYTADESTLTLTGTVFSVKAGGIANAQVAAGAAIAYSKLNLATSIVNADIATGAAIAYSKLNLATSIVNADIAGAAAIAYSKLALGNSIVNADIAAGAAIAYSKLNLATSIVNADVAAGAAIAYSKLSLAGTLVYADVAVADTTTRIVRKFAQAITGGATSEVITHNLNTRDLTSVTLINNATPWDAVEVEWEATSVNTVTLRSPINLPASYRVIVSG